MENNSHASSTMSGMPEKGNEMLTKDYVCGMGVNSGDNQIMYQGDGMDAFLPTGRREH
jgi:hypothetical protein